MAEMVFERASEAFPHVRDFVAAAQMAESLKSLQDMISRVLPRFGLDYFLMSHHVDFGKPAPGTVQISNYPAEFVAVQREHGGWRDDPVLLACEKTTAGFFWSDVVTLMPLSDYHRSRFEMGRRYGLADSFVVPNHIPGEYSGSVHFTVGPSRPFPRHLAPALQSFATYGFEAARRLARTHDGSTLNSVPLTDRQIDCVLLSARGKSDTDIAQLLGLTRRTVNEYIEGAKRRYCVATRQQLIVRALFNSQITFSQVLQ
jgi:LuxR family transcriptional regulator, quorum-sensing system regulator CciR